MTRIVSPVARIQIGGKNGDVFVSGDGILQSVSVELGEDKRSSKCQVVLFDKDLLIGGKYQAISFAKGGIELDPQLLKEVTPSVAPNTPSSDPSSVTTSGSSAQTATSEKPELLAFLDTIAYAEGGNYDILYGGKRFGSYAKHPGGGAAGRYQIQPRTWAGAQKALGLKDFSPASQDAAAIYLIQQRKAMPFVEQGAKGFRKALDILSYEWASFPPQRYLNQSVKKLEDLEVTYVRALRKYQRQSPAQSVAAGQPQSDKAVPLKDKADSKPLEKSAKGTEIIVELGFNLGQMVAFHFVHIGTDTGRGSLDTTTFQGQSIRWLLTRRTQNTAYTKITLRQLAQKICDRYGLKLYMEGDGPLYQYLDATQVTDYELILREALAIGYTVREDKNTLILAPVRPNFTGFVITRDILQNIKFGDRASTDRATTPGTTTSTPAATAADSKTKNDRKTGKPTQTKTEDTSGMGDRRLKPFGVTGAATSAVHGTAIPDASITGLPKQEIGSIDLADDRRAQAVDLQNEQRRVRGYESSCTLVTTPEVLTLVPGSILGISDEVGPPPFNREFRVASVRHTLSTAGMRSEVQMYSPQAAKVDSDTSSASSTTSSTTATEIKPGGFVIPMKGVTGEGLGRRSPERNHHGVDIAAPLGTPVVASADGIAKVAVNPGGYGNFVELTHAGGIRTIYGHLSSASVKTGQQVKQGEEIGRCGSTGRSTGPHLHWQIMKNGQAIPPSAIGVTIPPKHRSGFRY